MAKNNKGFAYTNQSEKYQVVYGDTEQEILDKLAGWNRTRVKDMQYVYCNIGTYDATMEKYVHYQKYDVATGRNISPIELKIPGMSKEEFEKTIQEFKKNGARYNSTHKKWYVSPDNDNMAYFQRFINSKDKQEAEQGKGEEQKVNQERAVESRQEESQITLEKRYTAALNLAGYTRQPDLSDEMEWLVFQNEQGQVIKADGWGLLGDKLETLVPDERIRLQFEELIHPKEGLIYYCNYGTPGTEDALYENFEQAFHAYLNEEPTDLQEMGVMAGGTRQKLVHYSSADNQHHVRFADRYAHLEEFMPVNQRAELDNVNQRLNESIAKENLYEKAAASLAYLKFRVMSATENAEEWETFSRRVANNHRPQDYIGLNLTLNQETQQIKVTAEIVQANELINTQSYMIDSQASRQGFLWNREFAEHLKEGIKQLNTDMEYPFTVYGTGLEKSLEEHYERLHQTGYDTMPDRQHYDEKAAGEPEKKMTATEQTATQTKYTPELAIQYQKVARLDLQEIDIAREKLSLLQELVEKDIKLNGKVSEMTNYLLDTYHVEMQSVNGKVLVDYKRQDAQEATAPANDTKKKMVTEEQTENKEVVQESVRPEYQVGDRIEVYRPVEMITPEDTILIRGINSVKGTVEEISYDSGEIWYRVKEDETNFDAFVLHSQIYSREQADVLLRAENDRLSPEKYDIVAQTKYSSAQMEELRMAFKEGLTIKQVKQFANPDLEPWKMDLCKYGLQHGLQVTVIQEVCQAPDKDWFQCRKEVNNLIADRRMFRIQELGKQGFTADMKMIKSMEQLDHLTHRENSLKDICIAFKEGTFNNTQAGEIIKSLGRELQQQEMQNRIMEAVVPEP